MPGSGPGMTGGLWAAAGWRCARRDTVQGRGRARVIGSAAVALDCFVAPLLAMPGQAAAFHPRPSCPGLARASTCRWAPCSPGGGRGRAWDVDARVGPGHDGGVCRRRRRVAPMGDNEMHLRHWGPSYGSHLPGAAVPQVRKAGPCGCGHKLSTFTTRRGKRVRQAPTNHRRLQALARQGQKFTENFRKSAGFTDLPKFSAIHTKA